MLLIVILSFIRIVNGIDPIQIVELEHLSNFFLALSVDTQVRKDMRELFDSFEVHLENLTTYIKGDLHQRI